MEIVDAAREYMRRGWVPVALGLDAEGRAKRPLATGWPSLTLSDPRVRSQGWKRAMGIGIALGPQSDNLAAIDVDDCDLAAAIFAKFARGHQPQRWVWTARNRGHLYLREKEPSAPRFVKAMWEGREVKLELKAKGQQIAAPCTPGYVLAQDVPPQEVQSLASAWSALCLAMGLEPVESGAGKNYPAPWRDEVGEGERNMTLFVEAVRLAEAGMPYRTALEHMRMRYEQSYSKKEKMTEQEILGTVQSAFRKVARRSYDRLEEYAGKVDW